MKLQVGFRREKTPYPHFFDPPAHHAEFEPEIAVPRQCLSRHGGRIGFREARLTHDLGDLADWWVLRGRDDQVFSLVRLLELPSCLHDARVKILAGERLRLANPAGKAGVYLAGRARRDADITSLAEQ